MRRIAGGLWSVSVALAVIAAGFVATGAVPGGGQGAALREYTGLVSGLVFVTIGLFLVRRVPRNAVGWLLLLGGTAFLFEGAGSTVATHAFARDPQSSLGAYIALFADVFWIPSTALAVIGVLLLFPDGKALGPLWRVVGWAAAISAVLSVPQTLFTPGPLYYEESVDNPLGVEVLGSLLETTLVVSSLVMLVCLLLSVASMIIRFRRSQGTERQQLKWFVGASAFLVFAVLPSAILGANNLLIEIALELSVAMLPLAMGLAILRYRLYDIDVIINRALVYAGLTAVLVSCYLALVLGLQFILEPVTRDSDIAVAASTLIVAALFRPVRTRIQAFIDRRFYRNRYDAEVTLQRFGSRLRDEIDLGAVRTGTLSVVAETMQPSHASLWLKQGST